MIDDEMEGDALHEMERRADLQRIRAKGIQVEIDATDDTPLHRYMVARRVDAVEALLSLAGADPKDAIEVMRLQSVVRGYMDIREWVRMEIEASKVAHDQLNNGDGYGDDD